MLLTDRRAVITGAGGNLGRAVLDAFLVEGARVVAVAHGERDLARLEEVAAQYSGRCYPVRADVTAEEGVARLLQAATDWFGPAEILVNLVGGFLGGANLWEVAVADWEHMLALNLRSAFLCCRAFVPGMIAQGYGRVVSVTSRTALAPRAGSGPYTVSKAALIAMTQVLREELRGTGVSAVTVAPSTIDTPANREAQPKADPTKWVTPQELARGIVLLCTEDGGLFSGGTLPAYGAV